MPQESGPLQGTNFTDAQWRAIFGGEPGIVGDVNGSAYNLVLPTGSDNATLGSASQDSTSVVGGYMHRIAQGTTQTVTIPASSNAAVGRTDVIVVRLDPGSYTTDPGPCRLYRVPGVEGSAALPSLDEAPPGVEDMPLWAVTRKSGQSLNQAAVRDLRRRTGPNIDVADPAAALPTNVPLGTRASRGGVSWRRQMSGLGPSAQAEWAREPMPFPDVPGTYSIVASGNVTSNTNGDATLNLPYGGFPTALVGAMVFDAATNLTLGQLTFRWNSAGSLKNAVAFRIIGNTGSLANFTTRVLVHAIGR